MRRTTARLAIAIGLLLPASALAAHLICIDPGHGGSDSGAVGCGLLEDQVNLDAGLRLRNLLDAEGWDPILTRDSDIFIELAGRCEFANEAGAERFVSIHSNSNSGSPGTGTETYSHTSAGSASVDLRDRIQDEMVSEWGLYNRGGKLADFYVLRNTAMPATLTELGFINNCAIDATFLSDPVRRQGAAEAHLRALFDHFGESPGPDDGTLTGVVFEELGVGTDDMSIRLPGARIELDSGHAETARDPDGMWSFRLPPGRYVATAAASGCLPASRACDVAERTTTWCSIGLVRDSADGDAPDGDADSDPDSEADPDPDPDPEYDLEPDADVDADPIEAADGEAEMEMEMEAEADETAETESPETEVEADWEFDGGETTAESEEGVADGDPSGEGEGGREPEGEDDAPAAGTASWRGGGGCAGTGGSVWAVALIALCLFRRRPLAVALMALSMAGLPVMAEGGDGSVPSLGPARPVVCCGAIQPRWSPDGRRIAFSRYGYVGLEIVDLPTGHVTTLSTAPGAGLLPVWALDGRSIGFRHVGQGGVAVPFHWRRLDGEICAPPPPVAGPRIRTDQDGVWLFGNGRPDLVVAGRERWFGVRLSDDGRYLLYQGLASGIHVREIATGREIELGSGSHPEWVPGRAEVIFVRTTDDGTEVTGSDIHLAFIPSGTVVRLTDTPGAVELRPQVAPDGRQVAFDADGTIYTATLIRK